MPGIRAKMLEIKAHMYRDLAKMLEIKANVYRDQGEDP